MNVGKVLGETAQRFPHKTAVVFKDEKTLPHGWLPILP